jgi:hypothetical protein
MLVDTGIRQFPTSGGMKSGKELGITPAFGNEGGARSGPRHKNLERNPVGDRLTQKTNVGIQAKEVDKRLERLKFVIIRCLQIFSDCCNI